MALVAVSVVELSVVGELIVFEPPLEGGVVIEEIMAKVRIGVLLDVTEVTVSIVEADFGAVVKLVIRSSPSKYGPRVEGYLPRTVLRIIEEAPLVDVAAKKK